MHFGYMISWLTAMYLQDFTSLKLTVSTAMPEMHSVVRLGQNTLNSSMQLYRELLENHTGTVDLYHNNVIMMVVHMCCNNVL